MKRLIAFVFYAGRGLTLAVACGRVIIALLPALNSFDSHEGIVACSPHLMVKCDRGL